MLCFAPDVSVAAYPGEVPTLNLLKLFAGCFHKPVAHPSYAPCADVSISINTALSIVRFSSP
jgi:hypothetical protein